MQSKLGRLAVALAACAAVASLAVPAAAKSATGDRVLAVANGPQDIQDASKFFDMIKSGY